MNLSKISKLHYIRLVYRGSLFLWALVLFLTRESFRQGTFEHCFDKYNWLFIAVWIVLFVEMVLRLIPTKFESMGCQKQFEKNFMPTAVSEPDLKKINNGVITSALCWIGLNGVIALLHSFGIIHDGALILVALFYSICDMICILFFCPFQSWMMKNRCCNSCRIYNWDFAMICTPLLLIWNSYTLSLSILSIIILARWEITVYRHPERFSRETNSAIICKNCQEKLCLHKKQLHALWKKGSRFGEISSFKKAD
ncbi:MAG: hypothetical protein MJZ16_01270 [Bacteroidales bacterium]|nr:hypothetical protein [Bacteroidales bacterium]